MTTARFALAALLTALAAGCGESQHNTTVADGSGSGDTAADTGDGSADTGDDTSLADTLDDSGSGSADTGADTAVDTVDDDAWMAACPEPPQGDQPLAGRWSLSLFHFNIQYVAGGTTGFAEIAANAPASSPLRPSPPLPSRPRPGNPGEAEQGSGQDGVPAA